MKASSQLFSAAAVFILSFGSSQAERPGEPPCDIVKELRLAGTDFDMPGLSPAEFFSTSSEKRQAAPLDSVPVLEPAPVSTQKNAAALWESFAFFLGISNAAPAVAERLAGLPTEGSGNDICCIMPTQCGTNSR